MKRINMTVMALSAMLLWIGTVQAKHAPPAPPPNPTLVCQQSKLVAQGGLEVCLALNSANILKGAPDNSAVCQQGFTKTLATIDAATAKAGAACRYVANGDGTVSDLNTGLMWEQKTTDGGVHEVDNVYTWSTGDDLADGTAFTSFLATLNNGAAPFNGGNPSPITGCFANHCDWRLPSIPELQGILDLSVPGCGSVSPCIDATFGPTQFGLYWSATSEIGQPGVAWCWVFIDAGLGLGTKSFEGFDGNAVRAVRGGW